MWWTRPLVRLVAAALLPLLIPAVITVVLWILPGDPADIICPPEICEGTEALAKRWGLDRGPWRFYTGWVEALVMRLTDILMAFPFILLAIAIVGGLGPGLRNAMLAIAIVGFPIYTRLVRGVVLSLREREFVEAARALGAGDPVILARHIVPPGLSPG